MQIAALTVEIFARVLERCGVQCEVLGFTTRDWDGGEPAREWAADGYPDGPGRLNALEHIVIKGADVPWRRARVALGLFLRDEMLKENIDGEALAWAHRPPARPPRAAAHPGGRVRRHADGRSDARGQRPRVSGPPPARRGRTRSSATSPVQLAAIGIGHDVSQFYRNATRIAGIDELGPALTNKLVMLLDAVSPGPALTLIEIHGG